MTLAPPPSSSDPAALQHLVRCAQVEMAFERSTASTLSGVPIAFMVVGVLWGAVDTALLLAWLTLKLLVTGARIILNRRFLHTDQPDTLAWGRRFEWGLAADGLVFGLIGTWLLPRGHPELEVLMVATLVGIAAITLAVLAANQRAALAMIVPLLLPAMLLQLAHGDRVALFLAAGIGLFLVVVVVESRNATAHTRAMLSLRFRMDELAQQRQQALEAAERGNAAKSRFLATMSHEMRTPLHGILGLARLLRESQATSLPQQRERRLQTLERTGEHLLAVINDVLDYARIEGQHLRLHARPFELAALVEEAAELCRAPALEKGLSLQIEFGPPQPCWVLGDAARLRQVLLNLIGNAIKFTDRGQVRVTLGREDSLHATIDVIDTGPGVPAADRERIFSPFEQLDGSFSRRYGGTGLGLAISRELARAMGGDLHCLAAPDGGALFRLTLVLPVTEAVAAVARVEPGRSLHGQVLVAEDNEVNAIVIEAELRQAGLDVTIVGNGEAAVSCFAKDRFDLVLMDCQMPGMDGFEAARRMRQFERDNDRSPTAIVALTANALEGDRERSLAAGMTDHLAKPYRDDELAEVLQRHLAAP